MYTFISMFLVIVCIVFVELIGDNLYSTDLFVFGFIYIFIEYRSFVQIFFKNVGLIESEGLFDSQVTTALLYLIVMVNTVALLLVSGSYLIIV